MKKRQIDGLIRKFIDFYNQEHINLGHLRVWIDSFEEEEKEILIICSNYVFKMNQKPSTFIFNIWDYHEEKIRENVYTSFLEEDNKREYT